MSESAGPATFVSPTSPTAGLQNYDLEGKPLNLYPASGLGAWLRARKRRGPKHAQHSRRPQLHKDTPMLHDAIEAMVGTLSKSVSDIVTASPANRDELLAKGFEEFEAALSAQAEEELAKMAPPEEEEPLFKDLGSIGRIAELATHVDRHIGRIKTGMRYDGDENPDEPCGEDTAELLDHAQALIELALRSSVNEHVDFPDDDSEPPEGMHLIAVPMVKGGDVTVITDLPEELAKFAIDPEALEALVFENAASMLMTAGVPEATLQKLFSGEDPAPLRKAAAPPFPPKKKSADDASTGGENGNDTDPPPADTGGSQGDGMTDGPGMDDGSGDDGDDPLTVLGQLLAACMIQLNHIQEMVEGSGEDPTAADENMPPDGADAAAPADPVAPQKPMGKAAPQFDEAALEKVVARRVEDSLAELRPVIQQFLSAPAQPKAILGGGTLTKAEDTGGVRRETDQDLEKMSDRDRFVALAKRAYQNPKPGF